MSHPAAPCHLDRTTATAGRAIWALTCNNEASRRGAINATDGSDPPIRAKRRRAGVSLPTGSSARRPRTHCKLNHELTGHNLIPPARGRSGARECRTCRDEYRRSEAVRAHGAERRRAAREARPPKVKADHVDRSHDAYPGEEWRPAPGAEGKLEVSDQGHVRTVPGYGLVQYPKPTPTAGGYLHLSLSHGRGRPTVYVHKMVCAAFHGPKPDWADCARHLNDDQSDNRAANLAWGTHSDNMQDKIRNGGHHLLKRDACGRGHRYVEGSYRIVGAGTRECQICRKMTSRRRAEARRAA